MEKLFSVILLTSLSFPSFSKEAYLGPLGDQWESFHHVTIMSPLEMDSSLIIKTDKLILDADIVTNGHKLDIEAREIEMRNGAKIVAFSRPQDPNLSIIPSPLNKGKTGSHPTGSNRHGGDGGDGFAGDKGAHGISGMSNPAPITVKALAIAGELFINGNGQQGGKGGKGAKGSQGGKGGDGRNGYAKVSGSCARTQKHGGNGGDGGRGGLGGEGGEGGRGGANTPLELLLPERTFSFESRPGLGGLGGDPGEIGDSGDPGKGGDSDKDSAPDWCDDDAKADRGKDGVRRIRKYTDTEYSSRIGKPGTAYTGVPNQVSAEIINDLFTQKEVVINDIYAFQYSRLYKTLIQDSLRLIALQKVTREQIQNINQEISQILISANQQMLDELISTWERHFNRKIAENSNFKLYKENSVRMISLLKSIKLQEINVESLNQEVSGLLANADRILKVKIRNLAGQCQRLNELTLDSKLAMSFSVVQTPLCREDIVRKLLQDPKQKLVINIPREKGISSSSDYSKSLQIQERTVDQDRTIAQSNSVIVLYNRTYTEVDIKRSVPTTGDRSQMGGLLSYEIPAEDGVTLENIRTHIQALGLGAVSE